MKNENVALMDKCIFSGALVEDIENIQDLINRGIVEISTSKQKYLTKSMQEFTRLSLHDDLIDKFNVGASSKMIGIYGNLQTSIKDQRYNNLYCYSVGEYQEYLESIKDHLYTEYGIIADFSNLRLKQAEINRTFRIDGNFTSYKRVFKLLMANLPKSSYMKNQAIFKDKTNAGGYEYGTFYAKSGKKNYMELKIYDKKKALYGFVVLTDNWIRFELKLVGAAKIKRELKTNLIYELTDEKLNEWFYKKMQKFFIEPIAKWRDDRNERVIALMEEQRATNLKNWITNTIGILQDREIEQDYPELLDIEELLPLLDNLDIKPKRKYKVKCAFRNRVEQAHRTLQNRDDLKLDEVLKKLAAQELLSNNTPLDGENLAQRGITKIA